MNGALHWMGTDYHLLKRKTSKGKTIYYVAFLDSKLGTNGRPRYRTMKSTGTGNASLARKRAQELITDGSVFASRNSIRDYLLNFWTPGKSEYLRGKAAEGRDVSGAYIDNSRKLIEHYFLPYFEERGISKLSELTRRNLTEWRNDLYEHGGIREHKLDEKGEPLLDKNGEPVPAGKISPATQNKARQAVWTSLQWAVHMGMLPFHPGSGIPKVRERKQERQIFQQAELESMFTVQWEDVRSYAACVLAAYTGMRLGEVRGLQFRHLHLDAGYLDVITNYVEGDGLKPPKWGNERPGVPVPPVAAMAIKQVIATHRWGVEPDNYVFFCIESSRRPVPVRTIRRGLTQAMKKAGLPGGRTFHSFRHTFISHGSGHIPMHLLQRMVGHTNDTTTAMYQHATDSDMEALRQYQGTIIPFKQAK